MAGSPQFKVFRGDEYIAAFKDHLDAMRFIQELGDERYSARVGHAKKDLFWSYSDEQIGVDRLDALGQQQITKLGLERYIDWSVYQGA